MSLFEEHEWASILDRLISATNSGGLNWEAYNVWPGGQGFRADSGADLIYVLKSRDGDGRFPFILDVTDANERVVDSYQARPYNPEFAETLSEANSSKVDRLYTEANRQATGAASAYDSIIDSLDRLIGDPKSF